MFCMLNLQMKIYIQKDSFYLYKMQQQGTLQTEHYIIINNWLWFILLELESSLQVCVHTTHENWACSTLKRENWWEILSYMECLKDDSFWSTVTEWEAMETRINTGKSDLISGKKKKKKVKLLSWKKSNTGKSFPDRLWNDHPQKCPKFKWTGSEHPTLVRSALSGGWTRSTPDVSSNLNYFIKDHSVTGHSIWQYILYHYQKRITQVSSTPNTLMD